MVFERRALCALVSRLKYVSSAAMQGRASTLWQLPVPTPLPTLLHPDRQPAH